MQDRPVIIIIDDQTGPHGGRREQDTQHRHDERKVTRLRQRRDDRLQARESPSRQHSARHRAVLAIGSEIGLGTTFVMVASLSVAYHGIVLIR